IGTSIVRLPAGWHVVVVHASGIEPVLQRRAPPAVAEHAAIPRAFQRRHLVVTRAAALLEREIRIGSNGDGQDVVFLSMIRWNGEAIRRRQLIVCIERLRMTRGAAFAIEYLLPACGN